MPTTNPIAELSPALRNMVRDWLRTGSTPRTQRDREAAIRTIPIKERGGLSIRRAREAVDDALEYACDRRHDRHEERIRARLGHVPWRLDIPDPATARRMALARRLSVPIRTRLREWRTEAVLRARNEAGIRFGAAGGHSDEVRFTEDPSRVGYFVYMGVNYDTYRGQYKGWAAREDHHKITVPKGWRLQVEKRGLAVLDGMLTLDAVRFDLRSPEGVAVYSAVWARQGRGYSVVTEHGYIAVAAGESYHAETPKKAVRGLERKLGVRFEYARWLTLPAQTFIERVRKRAGGRPIEVTLDDARKTGSCEFGIRNWCWQTGLPYEIGRAPLDDVLDAYARVPVCEARLAIVHALRRERRSRLAA